MHELWVQIHELRIEIHEFKSHLINEMRTLVNSLEISWFFKILSLKLFSNSLDNSRVQFLVIISCFTFSWLRLQQETKWVNINFKRRDLTSAQKNHHFLNVCHSFFILLVVCFGALWDSLFSLKQKKPLSFLVYQVFNHKWHNRKKLFRHHAPVFYKILFNYKRHLRNKLFRHHSLYINFLITKGAIGINYLNIIQTQ